MWQKVELYEADRRWRAMRTLQRLPTAVPAPVLVAEFNRLHRDYVAELIEGSVSVRPSTGSSPFLDRQAVPRRIATKGLVPAVRQLFAPLDPDLEFGVMAGDGPRSLGVDTGDQAAVDIDTSGRTVRQVLGAIAAQVPGHAWLVVTVGPDDPRITRVGFIHADGSSILVPIRPRAPNLVE